MRGHVKEYEGKQGKSWMVQYYISRGADGKYQHTTKRGFKTKKAAEAYLAEVTKSLNDGTYIDPSQDKFMKFAERWLEFKLDFVRPRTIEIYQRTLRLHVLPKLGHIKVNELRPYHIQDLYAHLKRKNDLSNRYISQIHNMLHDMFDRALKWEMVNRNIVDMVDSPKPENVKFEIWSMADVQRFLNAKEVKEHRFYVAFLLALTTGMRQGEIVALQWSDIDLDEAIINVQRSVTYKRGTPLFGPTKSESGNRTITLPQDAVKALRQHKARQNEERVLQGPGYHNLDLVVARINGNIVTQTFLRAKFKALIETLGMPDIRFHDLRHTHSSMLLELGENMKTLQQRLGHADYQITANTYTHVSKTLQIRPAQLLQDALFNPKK